MNNGDKRQSLFQMTPNTNTTIPKPKFKTRDLAALHFLLNIPMAKENSIRQAGMMSASKAKALDDTAEWQAEEKSVESDENENESTQIGQQNDFLGSQVDAAGKKLKGPTTVCVQYPNNFRYHLLRISDQSALVRQWEDQLLSGSVNEAISTPLLSSRVFFSRARSYPNMVFSVIKYDAGEEKAKIDKIKAEDKKGLEVFNLPKRDWRGFSYKRLFKGLEEGKSSDYYFQRGYLYDPNCIDDPGLLHGSHRYVLQRAASTGPIISSIILYVNKKELKESLNEQFRERHPNLPPSLTLSKIRNVKKHILLFSVSIGVEISTVAYAVINFERLCMRGIVTKFNRKLAMAVSVIIAFKFNENVNLDLKRKFDLLLNFFDREWDLTKKSIFEAEFGAFVILGFSQHFPSAHIYLVYTRLLKLISETSKHYLGEEMHELFMEGIVAIERAKDIQEKIASTETKENNTKDHLREITSNNDFENQQINNISSNNMNTSSKEEEDHNNAKNRKNKSSTSNKTKASSNKFAIMDYFM